MEESEEKNSALNGNKGKLNGLNFRRRFVLPLQGKDKHFLSESFSSTLSSEFMSPRNKNGSESHPGWLFGYYKKFGPYWNVFPKTDYTYLPGSPHYGRTVAPGIPVIPNMSRPPIGSKDSSPSGFNSSLSESSPKSRFNEYSKNHASPQRRSRQDEHEDLWMSIWWSVVRSVINVVTTVSTITTVTTEEVTAVTEAERTRRRVPYSLFSILKLLLIPLLFIVCAYSINGSMERVVAPVRGLAAVISSTMLLLTRSILMIPTILVQLVSIVTSMVLYPLQFWNGVQVKEPVLGVDDGSMNRVVETGSKLTMEDIRRIVSELLEERETQHRQDILTAIDQKVRVSEERIAERLEKRDWEEEFQLRKAIATGLDELTVPSTQLAEWRELMAGFEAKLTELRVSQTQDREAELSLTKSTLMALQTRLAQLEDGIDSKRMISNKNEENGEKGVERVNISEGGLVSWADVQSFVLNSIHTVLSKYHADRVALPDYALQSSGGYIINIRCTTTYPIGGKKYVFGIPLWDMHTSPDTILKPGIMPGECWAFVGSQGYVSIKLAARIYVTGFTMEHMPRELALHGHIKSAPKDFSVWGLQRADDPLPVPLGYFKFLDNGESLQQFTALEISEAFDIVELKIESNHGHPEYTCLYRFRVHGIPP